MQPNLSQTNQIYPIKLIIDPATDWEYDGGASLKVGGALTFDRVIEPIKYKGDKGLIIEGLNH